MNKTKLIIIGNGMVGYNFLEKLSKHDQKEQFEVVVFGEETRPAYDRVYLSSWFETRDAQSIEMAPLSFYHDHGFELRLNEKVTLIDRENKHILTDQGTQMHYDKIIMATGSYPFVPPIEGNQRDGCLVYRTIDDLEQIVEAAESAKVGAVVGGGLLGLEAAKALKDLGVETHVVEFAPRLMAVQLDEGGGALLKRKIEHLGVTVHTSKATQVITEGEGTLNKMVFADGEELNTDIVLFSAGIRPRDDLAKASNLEIGARGGVLINNECLTSDDDIYAIGECAVWNGQCFGLVAPGYQMAQVALDHLTGIPNAFNGADMSTKLKLMGVDVGSIGDAHAATAGSHSYVYENGPNEIYKRIVVSQDNKKLLGAVLVGDTQDYGTLIQYYLNGMELPENPDALILPQRDGESAVGLGPDALPDSAQLCSCYDVSKADVISAIDSGVTDMAGLKAHTQAATGCGGCAALCKQVLDNELEKRGVEVSKDICEHFAYSRQDLFNIIKVEGIHSFTDLLEKHGKGHGCEVCKQTVGNILASVWNDYAMEAKSIPLQDTNDNYLGNMQKDGTYSVIPRVPGGEITPDKLIVLGEVAKKYQLYTKVNGGQRIVLFGARMNDLPAIWKALIDAGFESGQAYAKALRTVKSCVGSTWCRYGVDDSVGMAITLENRYKGLRSPHKIKMGVSGCTRECAEAQAKDIGVIATENGWNLYVCGNGGMKPRHADLFATDLDEDTLFKYIDRLLGFYIKTADRLQRTSVWMENLEGGIEYLKDVVINDSLGLGEELEKHMASIRGSYECDWKKAIQSPEYQKRFRSFVNADQPAEQFFTLSRGQIRPATESEKLSGIAVEIKSLTQQEMNHV